mmetsp:Transcript_70346/g.103067  ORF Transcript_70346/g.103067 Transcript_70346/m.103067 type:complete len:93 (+) Transcript_70346:363-641(+)
MCHLPEAINFPLDTLEAHAAEVEEACLQAEAEEIFVVCRRGIHSQEATKQLLHLSEQGSFARSEALKQGSIRHIVGGLARWAATIESSFPVY